MNFRHHQLVFFCLISARLSLLKSFCLATLWWELMCYDRPREDARATFTKPPDLALIWRYFRQPGSGFITEAVLTMNQTIVKERSNSRQLSKRELEILRLIAEGKTSREIVVKLGI